MAEKKKVDQEGKQVLFEGEEARRVHRIMHPEPSDIRLMPGDMFTDGVHNYTPRPRGRRRTIVIIEE